MKGLIRFIKRIFGRYETGYEYWVYLRDIKVPARYRYTRIGEDKFQRKMKYYNTTGELQSKILLDKDFNMVDGYSSVRIAEIVGLSKVPVYFVER